MASTLAGATRVYAYNEIINTYNSAYSGVVTDRVNSWTSYSPSYTNWGPDYITQEDTGTTNYSTVGHWNNTFYETGLYFSDNTNTNNLQGTSQQYLYFRGFRRQQYEITITSQTQPIEFRKFDLRFAPTEGVAQSYKLYNQISTSNNTTTFKVDIYTFYNNYALANNDSAWRSPISTWDIKIECVGVNANSMLTFSMVPINSFSGTVYYTNTATAIDRALVNDIQRAINESTDIESIITILNNLQGTATNIKVATDAILSYCQNYLPNIYAELQVIANTNDSILDNVVAILNLMIQSEQAASSIADDMQDQQATDESEMVSMADEMSIPTINPSNVADAGNAKIEEALVDTTLPQTMKTIFSTSELVTLLVIVFGLATLSYVLFGGQ